MRLGLTAVGSTTEKIVDEGYHSKRSVDRYIEGFERVRLLDARHPREELALLTGPAPRVVAQCLAILDEHDLGRPVYRRRRVGHHG